jgi:hypothetical protein
MKKHSLQASLEKTERTDPTIRAAAENLEAVKLKISSGPPLLRFTLEELMHAADTWGFNCGPSSLCALLGMTPEQVRPHLEPFRGYMNPTAMHAALRSLKITYEASGWTQGLQFPKFGLALIQWGGPWMRPQVPIPARYKHTHWVASYRWRGMTFIYDVNAPMIWFSKEDWVTELVPWLLEQVKRSDGKWQISRSIELVKRG